MHGDEDQFDSTTQALLQQVRALGYRVSVFRLGGSLFGRPGSVELHAVDDRSSEPIVHVVLASETVDGGPYLAACELAAQVGIDLEG